MSSLQRSNLVRHLRTIFEGGSVAGLTDGQLLERFVTRRDSAGEVAFAAIVARHGPMVLGVCRRALPDPNDAADAFQATFLILVRKARSIRVDDSLGRWLYGVSRRVAERARRESSRRPKPLPENLEARPIDPDRFELSSVIDEELARLPEAFRSAIVLCDLEGMTHEEAARDLVCPVGTIKSRLARGRKRLRERLERRGMSAPILLLAPTTLPPALTSATVRSSWMAMTAGKSLSGMLPTASVILAQGVLKTMTGFQLKLILGAIVLAGVSTGGGVAALSGTSGEAVIDEPQAKVARVEIASSEPEPLDGQAVGAAQTSSKTNPPAPFQKLKLPDYIVEPSDIIDVNVAQALPGRPISGEHLVRPDGKVSLGFYGEVYVAGLTVDEIRAKVVIKLREFLDDESLGLVVRNRTTNQIDRVEPSQATGVSINVTRINSMAYFVQGEVAKPSRFPITGNETVLDALNFAGGLLGDLTELSVRVIRPGTTDLKEERVLPVDLAAIVKNGDTTTNYRMMAGDRVVVFRKPIPDPDAPLPKVGQPTTPELEAGLSKPVTLNTHDEPLEQVLENLRNQTGVKFVIDLKSLKEVGLDSREKMNFTCNGMKLRSALQYLLGGYGLSYRVQTDFVSIIAADWISPNGRLTHPSEAQQKILHDIEAKLNQPVTFRYSGEIGAVFETLGKQTGVKFVLDPSVNGHPHEGIVYSLGGSFENCRLFKAIESMLRMTSATFEVEGDTVLITTSPRIEKSLQEQMFVELNRLKKGAESRLARARRAAKYPDDSNDPAIAKPEGELREIVAAITQLQRVVSRTWSSEESKLQQSREKLKNATMRLKKAQVVAKASDDPAIRHGREEVAGYQREIARLQIQKIRNELWESGQMIHQEDGAGKALDSEEKLRVLSQKLEEALNGLDQPGKP